MTNEDTTGRVAAVGDDASPSARGRIGDSQRQQRDAAARRGAADTRRDSAPQGRRSAPRENGAG